MRTLAVNAMHQGYLRALLVVVCLVNAECVVSAERKSSSNYDHLYSVTVYPPAYTGVEAFAPAGVGEQINQSVWTTRD